MAEVFTAERQNAIEQALREVSSGQNLRAIGGLRLYRRQGGVTIAMRRRPRSGGGGGGGGEEHPFQITWAGTDGDACTVENGQIGGITPTLAGGDPLDTVPAPTIDLSAASSGRLYVYAVVFAEHTAEDGFVLSTGVTAVDVQADALERTDDLTGGQGYNILLATVEAGVVLPQPIRTSLSLVFADDQTASGQALMTTHAS